MFHISLKYLSHVWAVSGSKSQKELDEDLDHPALQCTVVPIALINVHVFLQKHQYSIDERNIFNRLLNILQHPPATLSRRLRTNQSKRLVKISHIHPNRLYSNVTVDSLPPTGQKDMKRGSKMPVYPFFTTFYSPYPAGLIQRQKKTNDSGHAAT